MSNYNPKQNKCPLAVSVLELPWIVAPEAPTMNKAALLETRRVELAMEGRDANGKFAPSYSEEWAKKEQKKATRLAARTFSSADVAISEVYGCDADELFI